MAHFYGSVSGARGPASRLGSANSGLTTVAASWSGAVETTLYVRGDVDCAIAFLFEVRTGDLVDIDGPNYDVPDLLALSQDAQTFAMGG